MTVLETSRPDGLTAFEQSNGARMVNDVVGWLDVALSCGYFDQAHFNHDFRTFSGINPSTYLRHRAARTHVAVPD